MAGLPGQSPVSAAGEASPRRCARPVEVAAGLNPASSWLSESPFSYSGLPPCVRTYTSGSSPAGACCSRLRFQQVCSNELKERAEQKQILKSETNKVGCDINFSSSLG